MKSLAAIASFAMLGGVAVAEELAISCSNWAGGWPISIVIGPLGAAVETPRDGLQFFQPIPVDELEEWDASAGYRNDKFATLIFGKDGTIAVFVRGQQSLSPHRCELAY